MSKESFLIQHSLSSHFNEEGEATMVNVRAKKATKRCAAARCEIQMKPETLRLLHSGRLKKGDAFTVAKIAGIQAAKKTAELIPLCHPLLLEHIEILFFDRPHGDGVLIKSRVDTTAKTGVEMEALTAAMTAALTIYDMAKSYDPAMVITHLHLIQKSGGKHDYSVNQSRNFNSK